MKMARANATPYSPPQRPPSCSASTSTSASAFCLCILNTRNVNPNSCPWPLPFAVHCPPPPMLLLPPPPPPSNLLAHFPHSAHAVQPSFFRRWLLRSCCLCCCMQQLVFQLSPLPFFLFDSLARSLPLPSLGGKLKTLDLTHPAECARFFRFFCFWEAHQRGAVGGWHFMLAAVPFPQCIPQLAIIS